MKTAVVSVRFDEKTVAEIQAAAEQQASNPAALIRQAVAVYLENLDGGGLEGRLASRLETLPQATAQAVADEIERRRIAARAAREEAAHHG